MAHNYGKTQKRYGNSTENKRVSHSINTRHKSDFSVAAWDLQAAVFLLTLVLFLVVSELKLLQTEILIQHMEQKVIDYEAYREMQLKDSTMASVDRKVARLCRKYPYLQELAYINSVGYLTFSMLANSYNLLEYPPVDELTFRRGIARIAATASFRELYRYNKAIFTDLEYFPVPRDIGGKADIYYEDSWFGLRSYGGNRKHEGTDLMSTNNQRGYFPILSISDGTVEKMGWLDQGGYRIGIRSTSGAYFYYAHLNTYAAALEEGDTVIAGQLLGFMGDSGYGKEGTVGQFDVHLHLGIYVESPSGEMSINPYWIMKSLEKNRINMDIGQSQQ